METCQTLLKRDLRQNLFILFSTWTGSFGRALGINTIVSGTVGDSISETEGISSGELQFAALRATSALLCCGPCFDTQGLSSDDLPLYQWLDSLLGSSDKKVRIKVFFTSKFYVL